MNPMDDDVDEGEDWLVSYADMMTLIACFFILMMAFANYDPVGFNEKAENLSKHFRKDKFKSSEMDLKFMKEEIARHELKDRTKISVKDSELIVQFSSSVLFENGKSSLSDDMIKTIDALVDVIKVTNPHYRVLVEGHADDDIDGSEFKTDWDISASRAAQVAQRFTYFGFPSSRVVPIGRGSSMPVIDISENDKDKESKRKLNRRVVIRLLEPYKKKKVKFGLGIYFKDATENTKEKDLDKNDLEGFEIKQN